VQSRALTKRQKTALASHRGLAGAVQRMHVEHKLRKALAELPGDAESEEATS
jgi:hypothetical protein